MKTNFNKLALALSGLGALAAASNPAQAIIVGAPGEAALVPFVISSGTSANWGAYNDTLVRVTVPKSVGNDVIPNCYTAPNTTPANGTAGTNCGNPVPGSESPAYAPTSAQGGYNIHWYFLDQTSTHRLNGSFSVSADDTYLIDWAAVSGGQYNNLPGYLVLVTEAGNLGQKASFNFMTDAYLYSSVTTAGLTGATSAITYLPSLPMSDGADGQSNSPTINNNVVEMSTTGQYIYVASPLVSGERTVWANGNLNNYVYDLPLAVNNTNINSNNVGYGTMVVVWNDINASAWNSIPAYRFNNGEAKCSGVISLPYELNLVYVPNGNSSTIAQIAGNQTVPGNWSQLQLNVDPYAASSASAVAVAYNNVCNTTYDATPSMPAGNSLAQAANAYGLGGGFLKITPQEPVNSNANTVTNSAVFFSIPLDNSNGLPVGDVMLGHSRGAFTTVPN